MTFRISTFLLVVWALCVGPPKAPAADNADLILHNGKIVSVDAAFSIHAAMAVVGDRIG